MQLQVHEKVYLNVSEVGSSQIAFNEPCDNCTDFTIVKNGTVIQYTYNGPMLNVKIRYSDSTMQWKCSGRQYNAIIMKLTIHEVIMTVMIQLKSRVKGI